MRPVVTGAADDDAAVDVDGFEKEPRLFRVCFKEGILSREPVAAVAAVAAAAAPCEPPPLPLPPRLLLLLWPPDPVSLGGVDADVLLSRLPPPPPLLLLSDSPAPPLDPPLLPPLPPTCPVLTPDEEEDLDGFLSPPPEEPADCLEDDEDTPTGGVPPPPPPDEDDLPDLEAEAGAAPPPPDATRAPELADGSRPVPADGAISLARNGFWAARWNSDRRSRRFDTCFPLSKRVKQTKPETCCCRVGGGEE